MLASLRTLTVAAGALAATLALSAGAYAAEITSTSFGVGGGFSIPDGDNLGDTNSISVINGGAVTVDTSAPGSLTGLVYTGETGTMQNLPNLASFTPISNFLQLASGVTLSLNQLSVVTQTAGPPGYISLSGAGDLDAPGFDPTPGLFSFTGTTTDNMTFSFAVESSTQQSGVPEPLSLSLLGLGLTGLGFRKRFIRS